MAIVTGITAERMQEIIDAQYASGAVDLSGHLIFTRNDGSTVDAGQVKGAKGDPANYPIPGFPLAANNTWVRLATMDGVSASAGASAQFMLTGIGSYGSMKRGTVLVHAGQRAADQVDVRAWAWGLDQVSANSIRIYTLKKGSFLFEIWAMFSAWAPNAVYSDMNRWNTVLNLDSNTTVQPTGLTEWPIDINGASAASTTLAGVVELATNAEALTGTDTVRAITPANLQYVIGETFVPALLDPTYIGPGPAKVTFLSGGSLSTTAYQWIGTYDPSGNRVVTMVKDGDTWAILGHSNDLNYGGKFDLRDSFVAGWIPYNTRNGIPETRWAMPRAQRLISGIVLLSGLVGYGPSVAAGTVIATLPAMYRPDRNMLFPINNGDTAKSITINTDGTITVEGGNWTAGTYISLDGIAYPAAGVATWTAVGSAGSGTAFVNNWVAYNTAKWGAPSFWKDPYGFVWWCGIIGGGNAAADNEPMITYPATLAPDLQTHSKAASNTGFGFISATATSPASSALCWKNGTTNKVWVSLCGIAIASLDAVTSPSNKWIVSGLVNGWKRYSTSFPEPAIMRRGDGMGVSKGLLNAGTAQPIKLTAMPAHVATNAEAILYGVSAAAFARIDLYSRNWSNDDMRSAYYAQTGTNAWVSWDNQMWMVGD